MPYVFNPFTGNFDVVNSNTAGAGGSDTEVQFNDGGSLGGDDGLTFNKTTNALTVGASTVDGGSAKIYGDIDLDDGGSFSTTVQAVTPTANRTISFPDATGTVALVSGANGTIQYNNAGTNAGDTGLLYDATSGSLTVGGKTVTTDAPVINLSQTWNSAATTFTGLKLNVTNTASASTSNLLDLQVGGTSQISATATGQLNLKGSGVIDFSGRVRLSGSAATGGCLISSNKILGFSDSVSNLNTVDVHLRRDAAGVIGVRTGGDQSAGNYAQINASVFTASTAYQVSTLPSTPEVGMIARVTDGDSGLTFGNTVVNTGAGATPYLCWYNGTNWTVIGA